MNTGTKRFVFTLFILGATTLCTCKALPAVEQQYRVEAFKTDGDSPTLVLKIEPVNNRRFPGGHRQNRQEFPGQEEEDEEVQSTTPFIPAVIPALTKILTGIITGNLNDIFHGSTAFAPQNVSHAIDTVYNQVVGLAPPVSTAAPTQTGIFENPQPVTTPAAPAAPAPIVNTAAPSAPASPGSSGSSAVVQPLTGQSLVINSAPTTAKPASNEDDEDESEVDNFGFRIAKGRDNNVSRV